MMVVYLDLAFFLNSAADALALYVTARLAGLPVRRLRILAAAVLGGAYGAACLLPPLAEHIRDKRLRYAALSDRALAAMARWAKETE